ncbi:flippase [Niabella ginsenosidivorans]|uniref:Flippase n=1 Tax=Niabella ginsenosidivorans TaxID=1176587 RepID=A0A1A9HYZ5_9BACT|nr:oligosaccharide flippase family protein [Niabella ginsenosidivorans]ANH80628.1 flippase [Niabella ginsenosidivorans]
MSTARRVIKNTGFLYAKMGITIFISLYTTRLILNALGASDFGIFNIVGGAIAMLGFLNAAMAGATQRFMSYSEGEGDREKQRKIFNISVLLHFLISLIVGIALLIAGWFFFNGLLNIAPDRKYAAKIVYGSLIISTMFTVMTVPYDAVLNARENMRYYAMVGIIESVLKLLAAVAVVYLIGDKLVLYGIFMACVPLITMMIMRVYCHRKYEECVIAPKRYWNKKLMKQMTGFAGWSFLSSASSIISQYGMGIVLNHFFGTILNAAQGIANQISGQLMTFSQTALKALNPVIAKSEGNGHREMVIRASFAGSKFSFILFSLFSVPFIVEADYILKVWLAHVPAWAVLFCRLQLLRILSEQLTISINSGIYAQGDIKIFSQLKGILNILPVILTALFFYLRFPPYMLYIVWIFCWSILGGMVALFFAHKNLGMSYERYMRAVFIPCVLLNVVAFACTLFLISFLAEGLFRLSLVVAISVVLHGVLGWFVGADRSEKQIAIQLYKTLFGKLKLKPAR